MRKNKKRKTVALFLVAVFLLAPFSLNDFWQGGVVFQKGFFGDFKQEKELNYT